MFSRTAKYQMYHRWSGIINAADDIANIKNATQA
jgi:hypothetical protein